MEVKLQPSELSALALTGGSHIGGDNHIINRDNSKINEINTLRGTYQYLKSTGQIKDLTTESVNNTGNAQVEIIFFNRVPKVGSQTMMALLKLLAKRNNFEARRDKPTNTETILVTPLFQLDIADDVMETKTSCSYTKHVAYIDFESIGYQRPIYLNLVRDPIERLISWFYYVRAPWYIAQRKKQFPKEYRLPSIAWLKKDFDSCILQHDPECVYEQDSTVGLADHRRQMLFFCGQKTELCMPFNSYAAMQLAKHHVETHYAVVGTWEDANITLSVLERYIPRFFAGATETYYNSESRLYKVNRNSIRPSVSQNVRDIISKNLTNELEFYYFCKQRLYKQYIAANLPTLRLP